MKSKKLTKIAWLICALSFFADIAVICWFVFSKEFNLVALFFVTIFSLVCALGLYVIIFAGHLIQWFMFVRSIMKPLRSFVVIHNAIKFMLTGVIGLVSVLLSLPVLVRSMNFENCSIFGLCLLFLGILLMVLQIAIEGRCGILRRFTVEFPEV